MSPRGSFTPAPAGSPEALVDRLAGRLIGYAAQAAPHSLSARLEEEWLADLQAQPSSLARLCFALGCCWAACVITQEHAGASALTASLMAGKTLGLAIQSLLPRHSSTFAFVLCAHLGVLQLLGTYLTFSEKRPAAAAAAVIVNVQTDAAHSALPSAVTPDTPSAQLLGPE